MTPLVQGCWCCEAEAATRDCDEVGERVCAECLDLLATAGELLAEHAYQGPEKAN